MLLDACTERTLVVALTGIAGRVLDGQTRYDIQEESPLDTNNHRWDPLEGLCRDSLIRGNTCRHRYSCGRHRKPLLWHSQIEKQLTAEEEVHG